MEIVLLLAILIFLIFILRNQKKNATENQNTIQRLESKIDELEKQIVTSTDHLSQSEKTAFEKETEPITEEIFWNEKIQYGDELEQEDVTEQQIEDEITPLEDTPSIAAIQSDDQAVEIRENIPSNIPPIPESSRYEPLIPKKSWIENFKEKNPDIEKFIGENLINKIGILILVLGISFFVKYAIDKDWINEPARVGIGILAGSIVMGIAHRLRKNYPAFSSVFVGGAISIYYLTIGIAFHDYKLFSQTVAFIIMVVITVFGAFVSVSYNRKELAIISLIGGFAVPFMVSTGEGNYKVLLTYIAILNVGMLIIAYFKKWNIVTFLAFIFTVILYSGWVATDFYSKDFSHLGALVFLSIFYVIFSLATVINNLRNNGNFTKLDYFIILVNTFFYFGMGALIIQNWKPEYKGIFTIALAVYNLIFAIILYKKYGINRNAIYLLLGLTLTFITITIPFQFNGNFITLFWACEAVLLVWLSQKSKIATFKVAGIIVQMLMLISLFMDWILTYGSGNENLYLKPFLNKIFLTGLVAVASLVATHFLLKKEKQTTKFYFLSINPKYYRFIAISLAIIIGYLVGILEIYYQAVGYFVNYSSATAYPVWYHYVFSAVTVFFLLRNQQSIQKIIALVIAALNIFLYITIFYTLTSDEILTNYSRNYNNDNAFIIHYFITLCVAYFLYVLVKHRKDTILSAVLNHKIALWVFAFTVVYVLSNEVMVHGLFFSNDIINQAELVKKFPYKDSWSSEKFLYIDQKLGAAKTQIIKIGYPVLWGLLSFLFLIIGIKKQNKQLRIIALSLLGITILKLFLYDIKNVSETGKIIAFILLGVLILIISFVYQKIKKLVIDEPQKKNDEENI